MNDAKLKRPVFEPARVRNIIEAVYRKRLIEDSGYGADERMVAKDGDGGLKLRGRAAIYDSIVRTVLDVVGVQP